MSENQRSDLASQVQALEAERVEAIKALKHAGQRIRTLEAERDAAMKSREEWVDEHAEVEKQLKAAQMQCRQLLLDRDEARARIQEIVQTRDNAVRSYDGALDQLAEAEKELFALRKAAAAVERDEALETRSDDEFVIVLDRATKRIRCAWGTNLSGYTSGLPGNVQPALAAILTKWHWEIGRFLAGVEHAGAVGEPNPDPKPEPTLLDRTGRVGTLQDALMQDPALEATSVGGTQVLPGLLDGVNRRLGDLESRLDGAINDLQGQIEELGNNLNLAQDNYRRDRDDTRGMTKQLGRHVAGAFARIREMYEPGTSMASRYKSIEQWLRAQLNEPDSDS